MKKIILNIILFIIISSNLIAADEWVAIDKNNSGLKSDYIDIIGIRNNKKYFISNEALYIYDGKTWDIKLNIENNDYYFRTGGVHGFAEDSQNNIWFANRYLGLAKYDGSEWKLIILHDDKSMRSINDVVFHNGILWASSDTLGIYRFDGNEWQNFNPDNSEILYNYIYKLAVDSSGNVWASCNSAIIKYDGSNVTNYNPENSPIPKEYARDIAFDSDNNLWATYSNGLYKYAGENWTVYNLENSEIPVQDLGIIAIENNILWICSRNAQGMLKFDGTNFEQFKMDNSGLLSNAPRDISIDTNGNKWIATIAGVSVYREGGVILGVEEGGSPAGKTAPNPAEQTVNIEYTLAAPGNVSIEVYTSAGSPAGSYKAGWQEEGGNNYIIPLSNFPSGSYYYKVRCGKQVVNGSFIVRK